MEFNPRYAAYAKAHGNAAEAQLEHDTLVYPGGCMCGFILWITEAWGSFYAETKTNRWTHNRHELFDNWLSDREVKTAPRGAR